MDVAFFSCLSGMDSRWDFSEFFFNFRPITVLDSNKRN